MTLPMKLSSSPPASVLIAAGLALFAVLEAGAATVAVPADADVGRDSPMVVLALVAVVVLLISRRGGRR
jgi:hypothetical protein